MLAASTEEANHANPVASGFCLRPAALRQPVHLSCGALPAAAQKQLAEAVAQVLQRILDVKAKHAERGE
jgi:hypothetical protein